MRYWIFICVVLLACSPSPQPLAEEKVVNSPDLRLFDKFAPMLPMDDGSVLIFRQDGQAISLWPDITPKQTVEKIKEFDMPYSYREGRSELYPATYASVRSSKGVWLVGATIEFIGPSKQHLSGHLQFPRNNPTAVALPDGSILVAGGIPWVEVIKQQPFQNRPEFRSIERVSVSSDGRIVSEYVAPLPACTEPNCSSNNGFSPQSFSMIHLGRGRVMFAGGYYNKDTFLYDSATNQWRTSAPLSQQRVAFTLSLLPDGRVLAAGGSEDYREQSTKNMTTEIWDPKTDKWTAGPLLPVPMQHHTAIVIDNKTVVLAGGRFAGVLAWDIDQPQWRIAAQLALARADAGVAYLGNNRLAIIAGSHARTYDEAWGRRTEGYSLVDISREATRVGTPTGYDATGQAFAVHGSKLFVAGGKITSTFDGSVDSQPTANVELYDYRDNSVRSLSTLPFGASSAKAIWLDDHRVLTMALKSGDLKSMWFGIFDMVNGSHTTLPLPRLGSYAVPTNAYSKPNAQEYADGNRIGVRDQEYYQDLQMIGVHDNHVLIGGQRAGLHWLDITNNTSVAIPTLPHGYETSIRLLNNGKIVRAGGYTYFDIVLSRVENCEDCPEQYVESEKSLPLSTYQMYDTVTKKWQKSAPSTALGGPVAILADGRVAKLGTITERVKNTVDTNSPTEKSLKVLELSNPDGTGWQSLKLPQSVLTMTGDGKDRLLSPTNLDGSLGSLLFLGVSSGDEQLDWWWIDLNNETSNWQHLNLTQTRKPAMYIPSDVYFGSLQVAGHDVGLVINQQGMAVFEK
ncbi:MAG: hypothetical protein Q8L15_05990 [Methylobacter sp.]|nr:hypothetical protein [Methylobacter sp.]